MKDPLSGGRMHIIGLGGIGMSAIAEIMAARGLYVQGSDQKDGANLRRLSSKGIKVFVGHEAAHLEDAASVVISTAVKETNPELKAARERGLPVFSRADALAALMKGYRTISITGSHGKTTTTAMVGWMMEQAGLDPTVVVGGIIRAWGSNARIGASRWMVVEADESDGTFIRLPTEIGVVTNIDAEHLDYYGTEAALREAFLTFFRQIPKDGGPRSPASITPSCALWSAASRRRAIFRRFRPSGGRSMRRPGSTCRHEWRLGDLRRDPGERGRRRPPFRKNGFKLRMPGAHNALNAAAAIAVGRHAGLELDQIFDALSTFEGVDRRFTQTGEWNGVSIYDDYAHHPAEIAAVLSAARGASKGRVIAVMQPHRYSRLKSLFGEFCGCFGDADTVLSRRSILLASSRTASTATSSSKASGIRAMRASTPSKEKIRLRARSPRSPTPAIS